MRFSGTVVVLASGPSLTQEDIDKTRFLPTIAVNNTWERAPHSAVIFAGDHKWWINEGDKVDIPAKRFSLSYNSERQYNATRFDSKIAKKGGYNSGCVAIELAIKYGAERVLLVGFDCSVKNGIHWHGPHKRSANPNPVKCALWMKQFETLRSTHPNANIINCSRYTELDVFPKAPLDEALCGLGLTSDIPYPSVKGYFQTA